MPNLLSLNPLSNCSGDKPEDLYPEAAAELAVLGHASTVSYVEAAARAVFCETGLLPHVNAGACHCRHVTMTSHLLHVDEPVAPPTSENDACISGNCHALNRRHTT